jgi:ATP-dependent Clp protease protease subunit
VPKSESSEGNTRSRSDWTEAEIDAFVDQLTANADKARAEGEAALITAKSEARKNNAEAKVAETSLVKLKHDADREDEKRKEELTANKYHLTYLFDTGVSDSTVKACIKQLATWTRQADGEITVELLINSPGGDVVEGFALMDYLANMAAQGHTVNTTAYGMAASMGGVLLQAGARRAMGKNSVLLIHEAQFGAVGSYGEVEDRVKLVNIFHERILSLFADRANVTKSFIKRNWNRKDWWLDADTSLKHGFIDEIK